MLLLLLKRLLMMMMMLTGAYDKLVTAERLKKLYAEDDADKPYWKEYEKSKVAGFELQNREEHARMMLRQHVRNEKIKQLNTYGARFVKLLERNETNRRNVEKEAALMAYYERHPENKPVKLPVVDVDKDILSP